MRAPAPIQARRQSESDWLRLIWVPYMYAFMQARELGHVRLQSFGAWRKGVQMWRRSRRVVAACRCRLSLRMMRRLVPYTCVLCVRLKRVPYMCALYVCLIRVGAASRCARQGGT